MTSLFTLLRKLMSHSPANYFERQVQDKVLRHRLRQSDMALLALYAQPQKVKRMAYYHYLNRNAALFSSKA